MKILYDHQIFSLQKYGGISRYFYEMIKYLKINNTDIETSLLFSNNCYISDNKYVRHYKFLPKYEFRGKQRLNIFFNKLKSKSVLKKQDFDIFHPTYYNPYFLKYMDNKPFVITVYDMIHEKFNNMFKENDQTTQNKKLLCGKATKIIAISQNTKKDLIEIFDIDERKIEVVYLGNSLVVSNSVLNDIKLPKKYILFVGSRSAYKNFNRFIRSISDILYNDKDLSVVCVGGGKFNDDEIQLFNNLKIKKRVFQYSLDDDKLSLFYKNTELFVFPSLYEGFGMPVLETFACQCPLVCSNVSSLPEIASDGAEYFNPYSEESIANAVKKVLYSDSEKKRLIDNGTQRLKYFSWKKTAEETKKIYESILK